MSTGKLPHDWPPTLRIIREMQRPELLRRIDEAQALLKARGLPHSDRAVSLAADLGPDFIRDLRRYPYSLPKAEKLTALATALKVPARFLLEEGTTLVADGGLNRERFRRAFRAATNAVRGMQQDDETDLLRADIAAEVYDVLTELAEAGEVIDERIAIGVIDGLARRLAALKLRSPKMP